MLMLISCNCTNIAFEFNTKALDKVDVRGYSDLMNAVIAGKLDKVEELIDKGANIDQVNKNVNRNSLMLASQGSCEKITCRRRTDRF